MTSQFEYCRRDCQLGAKAYQAIHASLRSFETLCTHFSNGEHFFLSSSFVFGVINYAKPFLSSDGPMGGSIMYPTKHLKRSSEFSVYVHNKLLQVRSALVAHDDFAYIEPRLLIMSIAVQPSNFKIPMSITATNKSISYPAQSDDVVKMKEHVAGTLQGIHNKLVSDLSRLRKLAIEYPDQAEASKKYDGPGYGDFEVPVGGAPFKTPQYSSDPWLNIQEPDFSSVQNGFRYQRMDMRMDFNGPETINLPNGDTVVITPKLSPENI